MSKQASEGAREGGREREGERGGDEGGERAATALSVCVPHSGLFLGVQIFVKSL